VHPLAPCGQRRCELQRQALTLQPGVTRSKRERKVGSIDRPTAAIYGTRSHRVHQFPGLLMGARERSLAERSRARRRKRFTIPAIFLRQEIKVVNY
jgi:hypothetical protein